MNVTSLLKLVWELKRNDMNFNVNLEIIENARPYISRWRMRNLRIGELPNTVKYRQSIINEDMEFNARCRHTGNKSFMNCKLNGYRRKSKMTIKILTITQKGGNQLANQVKTMNYMPYIIRLKTEFRLTFLSSYIYVKGLI